MKNIRNILIIIFLLLLISSLVYCLVDKDNNSINVNLEEKQLEDKAIFISYLDYKNKLRGKSEKEQKNNINEMINNIKKSNFNMIILQVRPFSDAIYESLIFPSSSTVVKNEGDKLNFDILEYFITKSHENNIKLHAWVNPYRVRTTTDISDISKNSIIYSWLNTDNIEIKDGIYLNPSKKEVLNLILNGIEELVLNYDIDGILYDDYFYPTDTIDLKNFEEYQNNGGTLSLKDYRINNINTLIKETYKTIKGIKNYVLFGISPAGNINNNLNNEYLDIEFILKQENYLDYVMPQIYFGFENETMPFINTLSIWNDMIKTDTKLYVALALYKSGNIDKYAGSGNMEWIDNNDIIKRQIIESRKYEKYQGFSIFRYDFFFNYDNNNNNLKEEINNINNLIRN